MRNTDDTPAKGAPQAATIDISVIVPTRDRPRLLRRAVASALAQSTKHLEIVVVDDGSRGDELISDQDFGDSRVRLVRHDRPLGVAAARNTGLANATGHWVAFLDDDDIWRPGKIATQLEALRRDNTQWCCCTAVHVDERLHVVRYDQLNTGGALQDRLLACNAIPGGASGVVCDRTLAIDVGGFDTHLSVLADWDLWIRLALTSAITVVGEPLFAYVLHRDGMSGNADAAQREFEYVKRKYERERRVRGIRMNDLAWATYLAERGDGRTRLQNVRSRLNVLNVRRSPRLAAWAMIPLVPGATRARARARANRMPAAERVAIERWLATVSAQADHR